MRVLSLFSGLGAHDLGLEWAGMEIVGQVEIDEYCRSILTKHWPTVPKFNDITTVTIDDIRSACGHIDIITGGFPCVDISTAGKGAGIYAPRSGLFWEMLRIIEGIKPAWLLIENVPALRIRGGDEVLLSLEKLGYTCEPLVVGAWAVGAPHRRDRVWIVANNVRLWECGRVGQGERGLRIGDSSEASRENSGRESSIESGVANSNSITRGAEPVEGRSSVVATESLSEKLESNGELDDTKISRRKTGGGCQAEMKRNTPDLPTQALWATPTAVPYGTNQSQSEGAQIRPSLQGQVSDLHSPLDQLKDSTTGKRRGFLNPIWTLQLMGLPKDWL